jgi:hypothetical protein
MLAAYFARRINAQQRKIEFKIPALAKTPLNPRSTIALEGRDYRVENVAFQSQPNFWVCSALYIPKTTRGPCPAILLQRGHFDPERMAGDYHQIHHDFASNGFAVLSFDSIGIGARHDSSDPLYSPTLEHFALGALLSLWGDSLADRFLWDGMCAVDYLQSRPEIDRDNIYAADYSDTGWSMAMLAAADPRIKRAAIRVHIPVTRRPLPRDSWNQLDDPEQPFNPIDVLNAIAPRPLLALVEEKTELQGLGPESKVLKATEKNWPDQFRLETMRFFGAADPRTSDSGLAPEAPKVPAGASIYQELHKRPPSPSIIPNAALIRQVLTIPAGASDLAPREFAPNVRVEFLSEPGIYIPGGLYRPNERANGKIVVYAAADATTFKPEIDDDLVPDKKTDVEEDDRNDVVEDLLNRGFTVLRIDVRGFGETAPRLVRRALRGPYEHLRNTEAALASLAWELSESLIGMRVLDMMQAAEYASRYGEVWLAGSGMAALWALYAAALSEKVAGVAVRDGLVSYRSLTNPGVFMQATSQIPIGVLNHFDLPQVAASIAPRPLGILNPQDHQKNKLTPAAATVTYAPVVEAYRQKRAEEKFRLAFDRPLASLL